jgi:LacI family transcriptional regulator
MAQGRDAMASMLQHRQRPTAVFCANDVQAVGAIEACYHAGLQIPGDLSIIGFDDLPIAESTRPPLTTIRVPAYEMGHKAAEALMHAIRAKAPIRRVELPTELVLRQSTAPAP